MKILFYRYNNICELDVILAFKQLGHTVLEKNNNVNLSSIAQEILLSFKNEPYDFVFSINFFPNISYLCEKLSILYVCWSVDCPVLEYYSKSIKNMCNRIFLFDKIQYLELVKYNPDNIYYLPLGTNVERWDEVIEQTPGHIKNNFAKDVSFVGSLYCEKSPIFVKSMYEKMEPRINGYIQGIIDAQKGIYGYNFIEEVITKDLVDELKKYDDKFYTLKDGIINTDYYVAANYYLGMEVSHLERIELLNYIAKNKIPITLYSRSETAELNNVYCEGGISTHKEMPLVFHESKININITAKQIQSGIPLRVFDIMGCGGFCLSNYQAELEDYFEIGKDLDCFEDARECVEKIWYYLLHEDERRLCAERGYEKVKSFYQYKNRIKKMLEIIVGVD